MKRFSFFSCCFFILSLSVTSCSIEPDFEEDKTENGAAKDGIKPTLNFLGDSIIDYWNNLDSYFEDYNCFNYGCSKKGIDTFLGKVDIAKIADTECVIEIGTNDMMRVINANNVDNYIEHYIEVLKSLKAKRIYLLSLLPRNRAKDKGFDYNSYYPIINDKIRILAKEKMNNIVYIPVYDLFLINGQVNWEYTYDGLHPNINGYKVIADEIKKNLIKEV